MNINKLSKEMIEKLECQLKICALDKKTLPETLQVLCDFVDSDTAYEFIVMYLKYYEEVIMRGKK